MKKLLLLNAVLFPLLVFGQIANYQHQELQGYDVYVELEALNFHDVKTNEALNRLGIMLRNINEDMLLEQEIIDSLQAVKIFVDWNTTNGAAVYHPSRQWLINNGYPPEKEQSVEISNITNFINWTHQNQPFMVMHELAHAYHDRVFSFQYAPIIEAYNEAMSNNLYNSVSYHAGNGTYFNQQAYATTNHIEYFAELTEAYLGTNDFYPFNRAELKSHDSVGYKVVAEIWKFNLTTSIPTVEIEQELKIFPNPTNGIVTIQTANNLPIGPISIIDSSGKVLKEFIGNTLDNRSIDISELPSGNYFLNINRKKYKIIKTP